jgi:hypothetical protein
MSPVGDVPIYHPYIVLVIYTPREPPLQLATPHNGSPVVLQSKRKSIDTDLFANSGGQWDHCVCLIVICHFLIPKLEMIFLPNVQVSISYVYMNTKRFKIASICRKPCKQWPTLEPVKLHIHARMCTGSCTPFIKVIAIGKLHVKYTANV